MRLGTYDQDVTMFQIQQYVDKTLLPKRTSLPSMLPNVGPTPTAVGSGLSKVSAQQIAPVPMTNMTENDRAAALWRLHLRRVVIS